LGRIRRRMTIKIPDKIKILHKVYDIVERTSLTEQYQKDNYGQHDGINLRIEYMAHTLGSETVDTILHELFHAIYKLFGLDTKSSEEEVVTRMATGLTTLMKDNPEFFKVLLKKINE